MAVQCTCKTLINWNHLHAIYKDTVTPQPHTHTQRLVHTEPHRRQQQRHEESRNENELMHKHRQ